MDIRDECRKSENDQIKVRIGALSDIACLQSTINDFGAPDIVLDDRSRIMEHIKAIFLYLFARMNREALDFAEDLHTAYWLAYEGALRQLGTFIDDMKDLIDEINADNSHQSMNAGPMPRWSTSTMVRDISFRESVVIERTPFTDRMERSTLFLPSQTN